MSQPLDNLSGPGKQLKAEAPDAAELAGLLRTGLARLADARNTSLALESRFDLAYNAAHALCLAALRRKGYRAGNRYIVFRVLPHAGLGARGVAGAGQVPQHSQPGRVRRAAGCGCPAGRRSDHGHADSGGCDAAVGADVICYLKNSCSRLTDERWRPISLET